MTVSKARPDVALKLGTRSHGAGLPVVRHGVPVYCVLGALSVGNALLYSH